MPSLAHQRCLNHADREAAVRCPGCRRFFCRECVSEHEHRYLCATCIAAASAGAGEKHHSGFITSCFRFVGGVAVACLFFYLGGKLLLTIPSEFHEERGNKLFEIINGEGELSESEESVGEGEV